MDRNAGSPLATPELGPHQLPELAEVYKQAGSIQRIIPTAEGVLLVAATFTESLKRIPAIRSYSQWINPVSGLLLVAGGTYFFLDSIPALA